MLTIVNDDLFDIKEAMSLSFKPAYYPLVLVSFVSQDDPGAKYLP